MNLHRAQSLFSFLLLLFCGWLLLSFPQTAVTATQEGVSLCLSRLVPVLYPFLVLCNLLLCHPCCEWLGRRLSFLLRPVGFKSSSAACVLLLSWLGGYAVCTQSVATLQRQNRISHREAALLLLLGCCSGPGFVIGMVGGLLLGSSRWGVVLYFFQIAANFIVAATLLPLLKRFDNAQSLGEHPAQTATSSLSSAIQSAVSGCLAICGSVLFFHIFCKLLCRFFPSALTPFLSAALEITSGCTDFAALGGTAALYGCCGCLSALGLAIYAQIGYFYNDALSLRLLLFSRCLHLPVLCGLVRLAAPFLPAVATASAGQKIIISTALPPDCGIIICLFLCSVLYKLTKRHYNG